jgi:hypothetical protein
MRRFVHANEPGEVSGEELGVEFGVGGKMGEELMKN